MDITDFTQNAQVFQIIRDLNNKDIKNKQFSDIIDDDHQYVDLVMEGGGVLGVALLGYVYVLEKMNIRFLGLGGTSAGSINATLMAAAGRVNEAKSDWIIDILANKNLYDFVDGDDDAKDFVDVLINKSKKIKVLWKAWQVIDNFQEDYGLNPGEKFYDWVNGLLMSKGIANRKDLDDLLKTMPDGIRHRDTNVPFEPDHKFALVAADVTTQTKVEFPKMADLYWGAPDEVPIAKFVRASMSIPLFFHPLRITNLPNTVEHQLLWDDLVGYKGSIPKEVLFIDGGIMSNFPIDLFHDNTKVPSRPTFGVKLGVDRTRPNDNKSVYGMIGSIFDAARQVHDFDFILRNPDFQHLVTSIKTGDHDWLNFNISDESKLDLFIRGAECAALFLKEFDWQQYKKIRADKAGMYEKQQPPVLMD